jgi:hypothetical protein
MIRRIFVLLTCVLFGAISVAQPAGPHLDMEARVLNILFPLDVSPKPYFSKMVLRFTDSDMQLVVLTYPDKEKYWIRRCEITSYSLEGMAKRDLDQFIYKMIAENPNVKEQEIAAKLRVRVTSYLIAPEALKHSLDQLRAVRISPVLVDRVTVDEYSEYEYWYDNGQESVHYAIANGGGNDPQDQLGRWMVNFRSNLPASLKP